MKALYKILWNLSEITWIWLWKYTPYIFQKMLWLKGKQIFKIKNK